MKVFDGNGYPEGYSWADRYILFCGLMFVPAFVLNQPSLNVKRAHFWEKSSFRRNLQKNNIDIAILRFFLERSWHVCVLHSS